jgi:hypothetical protein
VHKLLILIIVLLAALFASGTLVAEGTLQGVTFKAGLSVSARGRRVQAMAVPYRSNRVYYKVTAQ